MLRHIVLMQLKKDISPDEVNTLFNDIYRLQQSIPQVLSLSWGTCNSPENLHQGYLHGFTMDFKNETDRDIYLEHPLHKQAATECILPLLANGLQSVIVFDYEHPIVKEKSESHPR